MILQFRGFVSFDQGDENPIHRKVEFLFPREVPEEDLEGVMYDVACMAYENNEAFDWITVVAYDLADNPVKCIEFGRRYATFVPDEFGGRRWTPSRDYWHGWEIPDSLRKEVNA